MNSKEMKQYKELLKLSRKSALLTGVSSLLGWDQETYMPPGASAIRAEQLETLAELTHKAKTSKAFVNALAKLIDIESGEPLAKSLPQSHLAALREWRRDYLKATALPKKFVVKFAKMTSLGINRWREAREKNCFQTFAPLLKELVDLNREKAEYYGYKEHPYDALLDEYEPEMTTGETTLLFSSIKKAVQQLLGKIGEKKEIDDHFLHGKFDEKKQLDFAKKLLQGIQFDNNYGRLDLSLHPFSSACHPTDSRITVRIHPTKVMSCPLALLHEAGHALYEMGLPQEHYGSPLCEALSLGMHESQSRWWETRIGMSKSFWKHNLPALQKNFKGALSTTSLDDFYRALNKVSPSLIRVEADEVTYPLHIILRFEIEKSLIEGSLSVEEIPEAWNEKMQEALAISPHNYREGALQDIHWSLGCFGYFPTYTLGNLYCAQLFDAFEKEHGEWKERVEMGDLLFIVDWLKEKVYRHGRRLKSHDLIAEATGSPFSEKPYIDYLFKKYSEVYQL